MSKSLICWTCAPWTNHKHSLSLSVTNHLSSALFTSSPGRAQLLQGDQEKLAGRVPIPLMDREKESELAEMQVKMHSPRRAQSPPPKPESCIILRQQNSRTFESWYPGIFSTNQAHWKGQSFRGSTPSFSLFLVYAHLYVLCFDFLWHPMLLAHDLYG